MKSMTTQIPVEKIFGSLSTLIDIMAQKKTNDRVSTTLLGVPDGTISAADDTDPYITKLGGLPVSFDKVPHCFTNVSFIRSG